jgi:ligand-binding sensor domain-containing protein
LLWTVVTAAPGLAQRLALARYDERDGLPQSQVQALAFDESGFLWAGTRNGGLVRFDGSTFRLARDLRGLGDRRIDALQTDLEGRVWIASRSLHLYSKKRFFPIYAETFRWLALGASGAVFAGGDQGIVSFRFEGPDIKARRWDSGPVSCLAADSRSLWIGRPDRLERTDLATGRTVLILRGAGGVNSILLEPSGTALCGTNDGLWRAFPGGGAVQIGAPLPHPRIDALLRDDKGRLWVTTHAGTVRLSPDLTNADLSPASGLPAVRIVSLLAGPAGEVWLGGDGAGLFRFAPSRFAIVGPEAGLAELIPLSIAQDRDSSLWISTPRGELARLAEGRFRVWNAASGLPKTDRFRDLAISPSGRLDATWARGLVRKEGGSDLFKNIPADPGMTINGGISIAMGETWLATSRGLRVVREDRLVPVLPPPLGSLPVETVGQDGPNAVLAAIGDAVYTINARTRAATRISGPGLPIHGEAPWHLVRAADRSVWVASIRGAVRIKEDGQVQFFDSKNGLPDDSVDAIVPEPSGDLWLTTDKGLAHTDRSGKVLRVYSFSDGLPAREGVVRSVLRDSEDRIWFGLVGALVRYDPNADQTIRPPPSVAIDTLKVANRSKGQKETVVEIAVIDFADPRGTSIAWKLGPHETTFSPLQKTRFVRWLGLAPGEYDFTVRAIDRAGRWGPPAQVRFAIAPLWYETHTAKILFALAALALGAALPATLRAGAGLTTAIQTQIGYLVRELLAPKYQDITDDPFLPGSPVPAPAHTETIAEILGTIRRAWNQNAILGLLGPAGVGKSTVVTSLESGTGSPDILAIRIPPARAEFASSRARFLEDIAQRLVERQLIGEDQAIRITGGGGSGLSLTRGIAELSSLLLEGKTTVLLVEDDPGEPDPEAARTRTTLASLILSAGPRISLLVTRDVEPSLFAAEEPELARLATLIRLQPVPFERAAAWLESTAGHRARFAPGTALAAVKASGAEPDRLRALGSALLSKCKAERTNRVNPALTRSVLESWNEAPPPFLGALWARLSSAERSLAAALGHIDQGEQVSRPVGEVTTVLRESGFPLGPIEVGALVPRLVESGLIHRCEDRIAFRNRVDAQFIARHRPLSEERAAGAEVIGPYELMGQVGIGGMGVVYRARRLDNRTLVALKVIHNHLLSTPDMKRRFLREGEIGVRVNHPGVVKVIERGVAGGRAYIAMEFLPGKTVRELVRQYGRFPPAFAVRVVADLASAISALHAAGIIHRDIKSENIVISADGTPKILDFGLARTTEATRHTQEGHVLGTPDAMSPEQVRGVTPGPLTDIWALGVVLYEMLTGISPFFRETTVATMNAILEDEPEPLWSLGSPAPESLEKVLLRALEKDVSRRWQSAGEMEKALQGIWQSLPRKRSSFREFVSESLKKKATAS